MMSQNSYAIGGSIAQSWIEPLIKYNLIALGAPFNCFIRGFPRIASLFEHLLFL